MTVINPNSISGITSITLPSGDGNVLTIHTNDGTERFRIDSSGNVKVGSACTISPDGDVFFTGVCTATTLAGSGANLTALPAANLTGTLPAISGANLTGIAATDNVRTGILDVAGIATFRNDVNVGAAVTISESGIEASGIGITCANINGTQIGGRRNIIINGAMNVAQRDTSVAVSDGSNEGYQSLDRYKTYTNNSGAYTVSQDTDVPTDYSFGRFRNSYKVDVTTADTSIGSSDLIRVEQDIEAQDIANSGWDYSSSSGKITLSFWVKSVKAGTYVVVIQTVDGTAYSYAIEYTLSANTWTHVSKTIPGNSNLTIDDNNDAGLKIHWILCSGSDNNLTADTWTSGLKYGTTNQANLFDSTDNNWYLTGVQLEVGSQATPFEHRSKAEELRLCQRYFQKTFEVDVTPAVSVSKCIYMFTRPYTSGYHEALGNDYIVEMRTQPSMTFYPIQGSGSAGQVSYYDSGWSNTSASYHTSHSNTKRLVFSINTSSSTTLVQYNYTADAEL